MQKLIINDRYRQFYPPPSFNRNPSVIDMAKWKATDYRNWIIHYSVPCLSGLLATQVLKNWILFVDAYTVLNSDNIRETELQRAGEQLVRFCDGFLRLFGKILTF